MLRIVAFAATLAVVKAGAVELTAKNFDSETAGKQHETTRRGRELGRRTDGRTGVRQLLAAGRAGGGALAKAAPTRRCGCGGSVRRGRAAGRGGGAVGLEAGEGGGGEGGGAEIPWEGEGGGRLFACHLGGGGVPTARLPPVALALCVRLGRVLVRSRWWCGSLTAACAVCLCVRVGKGAFIKFLAPW